MHPQVLLIVGSCCFELPTKSMQTAEDAFTWTKEDGCLLLRKGPWVAGGLGGDGLSIHSSSVWYFNFSLIRICL